MLKTIIKPPIFCYSHTPETIATTVTVTPSITISNDSDFMLSEIRASCQKVAAFDGTLLLQLSLASGELWSNVGIDVLAFSANSISEYSGYPIRFSKDIRIPANSVLTVQLTNNNGADVEVQIQLWGWKVPVGELYE